MFFDFLFLLAIVTANPLVMKVAQWLLAVSFLLALVRLVKGPDLTDRVVALDLIAGIILGFTLLYAIGERDVDLMSVSLVIAVVSFLATVAIARYLTFKASAQNSTQGNDSDNSE